MKSLPLVILLSVLSILYVPSKDAHAGGYMWGFDTPDEAALWQVLNAGSYGVEDGRLVIKGASSPRIVSPAPLNVNNNDSVVWMRLKVKRDARATLILETDGHGVKLRRFGVFKGGWRDYRLYIGDLVPSGERVVAMGVDFARNEEVEVDYIIVFKPTYPELLKTFWSELWEPETVTVKTINFITTPRFGPVSFMTLLYMLTAFVFLPLLVLLSGSGRLKEASLKKALPMSLIFAGVLFAVRMDYNFLSIWARDLGTFSGKDVKERIRSLYAWRGDMDDFFDFMDFVKAGVPSGMRVRPASRGMQEPLSILARYYLLPVVTSPGAEYLWTYDDGVIYDPKTHTLKRGGNVIARPVAVEAVFRKGAALYRLVEEEK